MLLKLYTELFLQWVFFNTKDVKLQNLILAKIPNIKEYDYTPIAPELSKLYENYSEMIETYVYWYTKTLHPELLGNFSTFKQLASHDKALNTAKSISTPKNKREQRNKELYELIHQHTANKNYTITELTQSINDVLRGKSTKQFELSDTKTYLLMCDYSEAKTYCSVTDNHVIKYTIFLQKSYSALALQILDIKVSNPVKKSSDYLKETNKKNTVSDMALCPF